LSLEEGQVIPDLNTKLNESQEHASNLHNLVKSTKARLLTLNNKWNSLSPGAVSEETNALASLFTDPEPITALIAAWNAPIITKLTQTAASVRETLVNLSTATTVAKTSYPPAGLMAAVEKLIELESILGDTTSTSGEATLYGYLAQVAERDAALETESQKLAALLDGWNGQGEAVLTKNVNSSRQRLLAINQYPGGAGLIEPVKTSQDKKLNLKNIIFNLQALLGLNRQILAVNADDPIRSLWLEEGSIIFRAVITNPSSIISQTVPLKFYLPRELKTEDIITLDPSLETHFDTTEEALFVTGSYTLAPEATKFVFVEVQDIWQLSPAEVETIRKQTAELLKPLEKTAFFSQGTVLKSEVDVTLDKILLAQSRAITPENRIRAYREAKLELAGIDTNINRLQDLVAQASDTGSIFGFIGGVQAVAVWGILIIVIASFVFLTIYMRQLKLHAPAQTVKPKSAPAPTPLPAAAPAFLRSPAMIPLIIIATALVTIAVTQLFLRPKTSPEPTILEVAPPSPSPKPSPSAKLQ
jgi:hypothetical protein